MIVTAWNNGKKLRSGGGYGLKITKFDRDTYFSKDWKFIELEIPGEPGSVMINVDKDSFWNRNCGELINKKIGVWLQNQKYASWNRGNPPKFKLIKTSGNSFRLEGN